MTSIKGQINNKSRYGKKYYEYLNFLTYFENLSLEEKKQYQICQLKKFLNYVYENSKFYKEYYKNIDIDNINSIEDLKKLPIVDKEILRQNINDVIIKKEKYTTGNTGGTTGKSLKILMYNSDLMVRMATLDYFKSKVGFNNLKMKRATFNGKHIIPPTQKKKVFWRYNCAGKQMIYSSFHITEENLKFYVESLNKFKPKALDGFFTSMCDVANYIERHDIKLTFQPIAIFPTSETLTDEGRALLERVFKCKVYNQYASSEGAPFIYECKNQKLHIDLSSGVFEKMDDSDEILVTSFTTHGTPLIRYRIGDRITFTDEECDCGNNSPIVKNIEGRRLDYLYNYEGAKINSGNVSNLLKYLPNVIIKSQFIQYKKDEVIVLLQIDKTLYKEDYEKMLINEFQHTFGNNTKLIIKYVDDIPREKSGKYMMIKNHIDK